MKTLRTGLMLLLPLLLTILLIAWIIPILDDTFRPLLGFFVDAEKVATTFVVLFGLLLVLLMAILIQAPLISFLYRLSERLVQKVPIIGTIYKSFLETAQVIGGEGEAGQGQSVLIDVSGGRVVGIMTQSDIGECFPDLQKGIDEPLVAIYLPLSYQVGGYTVYVPKSKIQLLDWPVSKTMQVCLSGGVLKSEGENKEELQK